MCMWSATAANTATSPLIIPRDDFNGYEKLKVISSTYQYRHATKCQATTITTRAFAKRRSAGLYFTRRYDRPLIDLTYRPPVAYHFRMYRIFASRSSLHNRSMRRSLFALVAPLPVVSIHPSGMLATMSGTNHEEAY